MAVDVLDEPVTAVPGIGPARAACLNRLGIYTVGQLLHHVPRRHLDLRRTTAVADLIEGVQVTVIGTVSRVHWRPAGSEPGLWIGQATLTDDHGDTLELVWFARAPAGRRRPVRFPVQTTPGQRVLASGRVYRALGRGWQMRHPELEPIAQDPGAVSLHTGRLVPHYPLTEGLTQRVMRRLVHAALAYAAGRVQDPLPPRVLEETGLPPKEQALRWLHFPDDDACLDAARRRLAFEDLLLLRLAVALRRQMGGAAAGWPLEPPGPLVQRWLCGLPFAPTAAQRRAIAEIEQDLVQSRPMQRLLQGDVGSGKTLVAAYVLLRAVEQGLQAALLAPSDILAQQHAATLSAWFAPLGVRVRLLRGATAREEREAILGELARGEPAVVVGTHALLQPDVVFTRLAAVVVDEQHRFGVRQRAALAARERPPHLLVVSATPIPRTLALCLYGDLDLSVLDEAPPGRLPVDTRWVRPARREEVYRFVRRMVEGGRQAFVVFPAIGDAGDEGGEGGDGEGDERPALAAAHRLVRGPLAGLRVAVVHGRQPPAQQAETMARFRAGEVQVLLATSVVEVGVDVPNAAVMVIEGADRFGLAQLHQLRGRVGRGGGQAYCFLIADPTTPAARRRLQMMRTTQDGFALAQADLELRGPGELLGLRQSGLPDLPVLAWPHDPGVLSEVERWAERLLGGQAIDGELWRAAARRFGVPEVLHGLGA
ncbi:MAG: ATP-dependent DNA helicase RecG [Limnochordales bacterium]|nr:MAG: ATP-dependent DNA helicase RecG [Bacillota bacterium]